ncbi:Uncharacterized protein FWK35_00011349 [Aphis craccivora]|uniref:Uncharacterized protein n=1 Tax=Aphis craccivora TaxID=307492 RepID=A0A6G0Z4G2_APHCR|nr:Uncharacterized protein FWK35_00011349 [Aphis craccivora]
MKLPRSYVRLCDDIFKVEKFWAFKVYSSKIWVVTNTKNDLIKYPVDESDCFTIHDKTVTPPNVSRNNGHPLSCLLFLVEINPKTKKKKTMGDPPQCRNCQYYGHTATIVTIHHVVVGITPQTIHILSFQNSLSRSKAYYASIADSNDIRLPNSHTNNKPFTKFTSELSAIINPLIMLFTTVLNKQQIP